LFDSKNAMQLIPCKAGRSSAYLAGKKQKTATTIQAVPAATREHTPKCDPKEPPAKDIHMQTAGLSTGPFVVEAGLKPRGVNATCVAAMNMCFKAKSHACFAA
jgi:hypothetical protein